MIIKKLMKISELRIRQFRQAMSETENCLMTASVKESCWILEKFMRDLRGLQEDIVSYFSSCEDTDTYAVELPPVTITEENGIYKLRFGAILPFKTKSRCDLVCNNLSQEVARYVSGRQTPFMEKAVVVFCHHYRDGYNPKRKLRDYDNLERKSVQDALVPFFMPDDNPRFIRSFDLMVDDDTNFTELLVMSWTHFQAYIASDKASF